MKKIVNFINSFAIGALFMAVICVALGVSLIIWKEPASELVCMVFGAILIVNAIIQLVMCFRDDTYATGNSLLMFSSLIMAVLGAWMLVEPAYVAAQLIFIILAVILLYHGITDIKYSSFLKGEKHKLWYVALIIGFATLATGVVSLICYDRDWLSLAVGVGLLVDGLSDIWIIWIVAATRRGTSKMIGGTKETVIEGTAASGELESGE